ncbi:MAG TPA: hypothetical protein VGM90_23055 [Kofleriaceae bacterium]|jgi:hypothetical protein
MKLATSLDGQWVTVRRGRDVTLFDKAVAPPVGQLALDSDDVDLALVGPPTVLVVVTRLPEGGSKIELCQPPYLDVAARLDLEQHVRLGGVTGQRVVLVGPENKGVQIVRAANRSLTPAAIDPGGAVEFSVGLERNQVLFSLLRKLEVWDAVSARPLLRLSLQLPPPPRTVGSAQGHLWVTRPGSDEVYVYRLSDGRPFRHFVGSPVEDTISHPASPLVVFVTARGLVRLHCFAHSLHVVDAPWTPGTPLAQLVIGDDIALIGMDENAAEPWRVPIAGAGAPSATEPTPAAAPTDAEIVVSTAADKLRALRDRDGGSPDRSAPTSALGAPTASPSRRGWRDPLAAFGLELSRGVDGDVPVVAVDTELGELAHRLTLSGPARRALVALYSLYLIGEAATPLSRIAHALGDWTEALGTGDLGALQMLTKRGGKVGLRPMISSLLDGVAPRAVRLVGSSHQQPRAGVFRATRDGRTDAELEAALATQLGRIAVVTGASNTAITEARMLGATALALAAPPSQPSPWPRDAALVVVEGGSVPAWLADAPLISTASM